MIEVLKFKAIKTVDGEFSLSIENFKSLSTLRAIIGPNGNTPAPRTDKPELTQLAGWFFETDHKEFELFADLDTKNSDWDKRGPFHIYSNVQREGFVLKNERVARLNKHIRFNPLMTPSGFKFYRNVLGLTVNQLATLVETDAQTIRRYEYAKTHSTARNPAPRVTQLMDAYLNGFRPEEWPLTK